MERVVTLIEKLQQQLLQKASADQLLQTTQLLQSELLLLKKEGQQPIQGRIAVTMPVNFAPVIERELKEEAVKEPVPIAVPQVKKVQPVVQQPAPEKIVEVLQVDESEIEAELEELKKNAEVRKQMSVHSKPVLLFDPHEEDIPTLTHQQPLANSSREINEMAPAQPESINERLREVRSELSEKITDSPIKDLRKAIGINDRFLFINELFRGDEAMYERSLKTINNFSILAEAEYWIQRELKLKIGWPEGTPAVKQFDHLIRRRFN